jgi:transcriptional regulator with XRE-family HTH domain
VYRISLTNDGSQRAPHGTLGNCIRRLRLDCKITQVQLGRKLGVSQPAVASYENGRICPSPKTAQLMALTFNVPLEFLMAHRRTLFSDVDD